MPTLRVVNQLGRAPAAPISAGFGAEGATIGRSPDCVLVLPDPARHISREQARVAYSNGTYVITCLGSVNSAIVVNGAELSSGQSATLRGGDSIVVADYELCFDLAPAAPAAGAQRADAPAQAAASAIPDDFDPFAEPMAEPPPGRGGAPVRGGSRGAISPGPSPAATAAESDDDPFAMPAADRPVARGSAGPQGGQDPLAGFAGPAPSPHDPLGLGVRSGTPGGMPGAPSESIDALFGLGSASGNPLGLSQPLSEPNTAGSDDPMAAFGAQPLVPPASVADHIPEIDGSFRLPEAIPHTDFGVGGGRSDGRAPAVPGGGADAPSVDADPHRGGMSPPQPPAPRAAPPSPGPSAPSLATDEVRSIAQRAVDAHPAAFEMPVTPPPTDLLNRLNQAQRDALREQAAARSSGPVGDAPHEGQPDQSGARGDDPAFELLKSLLLGLGLSELPRSPLAGAGAGQPSTLSPELMRRLGELLKVSTQGTLDLLQVRATVKQGMKAEQTMIASSDNNPLKFSPDAQAALAHLLSNRSVRGFMDPVPALRDAYDDLLAHQVGFVAGMRAAMQGLIARFDPAELESRLTRKSMLDSMLPMTRRSRLWELFQEMYDVISREAQDDFERLFGREFLRAYEEQIERLRDTKR